ncbi:hypothetical protein [Mesoplasma photuris]|uniref:hypothetical protein n=1 Tax=Mesoplasma photuris TaxID=217731 RepID=UPI0004E255D0|nr:hypothetical protein [Mesoplasma photuris]
MSVAKINDISNSVIYNHQKYEYSLIKPITSLDLHIQNLVKNKLENDNIKIKSIPEIVNDVFPFIEKVNQDVVKSLINRNLRIKKIIFNYLEKWNGLDLKFDPMDEKDKFIIEIAKSVMHDINKFLYKKDIKYIYPNKTFINNDFENVYIGTIDAIMSNGKEWFLLSFKTSKTSYNQKYSAELFMQKELFESNNKFKISEMYILNPRNERVILEADKLSNYEIFKLKNT